MSSITPKEVLAINLQKSHSSSSLLLSSANLAWTPASSAILVTPQPEIDRPLSRPSSESSKAMTNEELIQSLRSDDSAATSNQSLDVLDGFQTISLNDAKPDDQRSYDSITSNNSSLSAPAQKSSLLDKLFSPIASTIGRTSGRSSPQTSEHNQPSALIQTNQSHLLSDSGYTSNQMPVSHSAPNFGLVTNNDQSVTGTIPAQPSPVPPSAPPQILPPPTEPPKGFVTRDYKIRGPLRLYDPNHGLGQTSVSSASSQPPLSSIPAPEVTPFIPPITDPFVQTFYNPSEYSTNSLQTSPQPIETNVASSSVNDTEVSHTQNGQQSETSFVSSPAESDLNPAYDWQQSSNPQPFSFVSEPQPQDYHNFNPNPNDWTQSGHTGGDQSYARYQYYQPMDNTYQPVDHHWFYQKIVDNKEVWIPFSMYDSYNLEQALVSSGASNGYGQVIPTDGGRFDVSIYDRLRRPVYWSEVDTIVRRCSWFYKREGHNRWSPYPEDFCTKLEESYRQCLANNAWNQAVELDAGTEVVIMHSQQSIWHYQKDHAMPDGWGQAVENPNKPRLVHRGALDGIFDDIDEGEPEKIDHLVFLVHGIGELCDLRFRSIVEVVDDFRAIALSQMRTHYKSYLESGQLGRMEILPISWHSALHGEETGIDDRLKQITLESIPKLRHFTNDTILDALFYTSPVYCQTIVDSVGQELNRLFALFCQRTPHFSGSVALGGHSLGSLIVFDILAHQTPNTEDKNFTQTTADVSIDRPMSVSDQQLYEYFSQTVNQTLDLLLNSLGFAEYVPYFRDNQRLDFQTIVDSNEEDIRQRLHELPIDLQKKLTNFISNFRQFQRRESETHRRLSHHSTSTHCSDSLKTETNSPINTYPFESIGLGFPAIKYPKLAFHPSAFFAMGSPIPMFLTVRGAQQLSPDYRLPTCWAVFNIFHPYDPIAYRLEPMIYRSFKDIKPVVIPHHKGRKRMHLELRDSIVRTGSVIKTKIYDSLKYTWNSINEFARAHKPSSSEQERDDYDDNDANSDQNQSNYSIAADYEDSYGQSLSAGALNSGRRIDYVLQESPVEAFNEYLFAIRAHACYWQSEDTALFILKELYGQMGYLSSQPTAPTVANEQQAMSSSASTHSLTYNELTEQQL